MWIYDTLPSLGIIPKFYLNSTKNFAANMQHTLLGGMPIFELLATGRATSLTFVLDREDHQCLTFEAIADVKKTKTLADAKHRERTLTNKIPNGISLCSQLVQETPIPFSLHGLQDGLHHQHKCRVNVAHQLVESLANSRRLTEFEHQSVR